MLAPVLDILRIRQYFDVITMTREAASGVAEDTRFVDSVRHALFPLPWEHRGTRERHPFARSRRVTGSRLARLRGRRVGVVASGGSGALAALVGVARALEEADVRPGVYALSSGAAFFGLPLAAGLSADEVAEFVLGIRADQWVDLDWGALARLLPTLGRGFTGLLRGERIEDAYRERLGDITLSDLEVPAYVPAWNVERNRLEYLGPKTHPRLPVARAVHLATALPLFFQAVPLDGGHYYDGATVDILPVAPLLDIERRPDAVIAVNCFHPHEFQGEDATGWERRPASILGAAWQVRSCQHLEVARHNLARLRREVPLVRLVEPVPFETVTGLGLYRELIDNTRWPEHMRAGRRATFAAFS